MSSTLRKAAFPRAASAVALIVLAGYSVTSIVKLSVVPLPCLDIQPYPWLGVATSSILVVAEALSLWLILCSTGTRSTSIRVLMCLLLTAPPAVLGSLLLMHYPPYVTLHIGWLWVATGLLILILLITQYVRLLGRVFIWLQRSA